MTSVITSSAIMIVITLFTAVGDFFIKKASLVSSGFMSAHVAVGSLLYAATAVGWYFLMRSHSLAVIAVLFALSNIVALAVMGHLIFDEPFGRREALGVTLAILAVLVTYRG